MYYYGRNACLVIVAMAAMNWFGGNSSAVAQEDRNFKKGVALHTAQSCAALDNHLSSSWWYSWGTNNGFSDSFCEDHDNAVSNARAKGIDYVPMFWGLVPPQPFDDATAASLQEATYLMTFNEPDKEDQANMSPVEAARLWPEIEAIAASYNLQIVAPCTTSGGPGVTWYEEFLESCASLNGSCQFEYTCTHLYYHAYPCPAGIPDWACIGQNASRARSTIDKWYNEFGDGSKPVWVTEYSCAPWAAPCFPSDHKDLMDQLTPVLQSSDRVYRYAWFSTYQFNDWHGNALNENTWTKEKELKCPNTKWVGGFGDAGWQIQTEAECFQKAKEDEACHNINGSYILSMDKSNCYCSIDPCEFPDPSYSGMITYRLVGIEGTEQLTAIGAHYDENFNPGSTMEPSYSPTSVPTPNPTLSPTEVPSPSPTSPFGWSREKGVECADKQWIQGFGNYNWQIQTEIECVATARSKPTICAQNPLVLSIDDHNCYCAAGTCETMVQSHPWMETHRPVGSLSIGACGRRPNGWKCTDSSQCQSCSCRGNGKCGK